LVLRKGATDKGLQHVGRCPPQTRQGNDPVGVYQNRTVPNYVLLLTRGDGADCLLRLILLLVQGSVSASASVLGATERFCAYPDFPAETGGRGDQLMTDRLSSALAQIGVAALARQFSRFLAVGVATTAVHYGVLITLVEVCALNPVLATTAGFLAATLLSYLLNRRYTFEVHPEFRSGLLKYCAAVSVGLVLNAGTMALLTRWGFYYFLAQVIASGAALVWNFFAVRFVVFRSGAPNNSALNDIS